MTRVEEIYRSASEPVFSFEFFPPRSERGEVNLARALRDLRPMAPDYVSVTYGAGGSTRDRTLSVVLSVKRELGLEAMAHSPDDDLRFLKQKVEAGATFLITQVFFDNRFYFDFVARAREIGIDVPIIPGVMPILDIRGVKRMTELSAAHLPPALTAELEARQDDEEAVHELGVSYATLQCAELLAGGAPGIHFITLNRSPATRAILSALRLMRPWDGIRGAVVARAGAS